MAMQENDPTMPSDFADIPGVCGPKLNTQWPQRGKEATVQPFSKFTMKRTLDQSDPRYAYKCAHSVLFEFNRSLAEDGLTKDTCWHISLLAKAILL